MQKCPLPAFFLKDSLSTQSVSVGCKKSIIVQKSIEKGHSAHLCFLWSQLLFSSMHLIKQSVHLQNEHPGEKRTIKQGLVYVSMQCSSVSQKDPLLTWNVWLPNTDDYDESTQLKASQWLAVSIFYIQSTNTPEEMTFINCICGLVAVPLLNCNSSVNRPNSTTQ